MEENFTKLDLKIQELSTNLQALSTRWNTKHTKASQVLKSLEAKSQSLSPFQNNPKIRAFFTNLNSLKSEVQINNPQQVLTSIGHHIKEMKNLSESIKNTENEISKAVKHIIKEDEAHKKNMEMLRKHENLLINETETVNEQIKELKDSIAEFEGEIGRMVKMKREKERERIRIKRKIEEEGRRLRKESDFLNVIEQKKMDFEESSDLRFESGIVQNLSEACCRLRNVESFKVESFEFSVFVIPSFLVLVLVLVLYL